jgi:hypothetical protein
MTSPLVKKNGSKAFAFNTLDASFSRCVELGYLLVSKIPIVPPANPHHMKLLISHNHTASVPKMSAPKPQPRAKQNIRTPTI